MATGFSVAQSHPISLSTFNSPHQPSEAGLTSDNTPNHVYNCSSWSYRPTTSQDRHDPTLLADNEASQSYCGGREVAEPGVVPRSASSSGEETEQDEAQRSTKTTGTRVVLTPFARLWSWKTWIHVLPVAVSILLILINLKPTFWYDYMKSQDDSDTTVVTWLPQLPFDTKSTFQIAAKAYELLVIASLSELTLSLLRRQLLKARLPMGLLMAGYRVGSLPYIFSSQFFTGALRKAHEPSVSCPVTVGQESNSRSMRTSRWFRVFLGFIVLLNTSLALLSGPASAILIVPDEGWFPYPNAFQGFKQPFYFGLPADVTWPAFLDTREMEILSRLDGCQLSDGWLSYWCPTASFPDLSNWVASWLSHGTAFETKIPKIDALIKPNSPSASSRSRKAYMSHQLTLSTDGNRTVSTMVSLVSFLTMARLLDPELAIGPFGWDFRLKTSNKTQIFQPVVQTSCATYHSPSVNDTANSSVFERLPPGNLTEDHVPFPGFPGDITELHCFGDPGCEEWLNKPWKLMNEVWNQRIDRPAFHVVEPDIANDDGSRTAVHVWFAFPFATAYRSQFRTAVFPCTIVAHWAPSSLEFTWSDAELRSNVSSWISETGKTRKIIEDLKEKDAKATTIKFDKMFLDLILPNMTLEIADDTAFGQRHPLLMAMELPVIVRDMPSGLMYDLRENTGWGPVVNQMRFNFEHILAAIVTTALARLNSLSENTFVQDWNATTLSLIEMDSPSYSEHFTADDNRRLSRTHPLQFIWEPGNVTFLYNGSTEGAPSDRYEWGLYRDGFQSPSEYLDMLESYTKFEFEAERYGFGTGLRGNSRYFAFTVVFVYLVIILLYSMYITFSPLFLKEPVPTIRAWGDLGELFLLAWNSKPTEDERLGRSGIKMESSKDWAVEVGIRADEEGRVRLATVCDGGELLKKEVRYR